MKQTTKTNDNGMKMNCGNGWAGGVLEPSPNDCKGKVSDTLWEYEHHRIAYMECVKGMVGLIEQAKAQGIKEGMGKNKRVWYNRGVKQGREEIYKELGEIINCPMQQYCSRHPEHDINKLIRKMLESQ